MPRKDTACPYKLIFSVFAESPSYASFLSIYATKNRINKQIDRSSGKNKFIFFTQIWFGKFI